MATLRDIQRRIRAVKNTRQITKAMKMVAAAKLRKVQGRMLELRPYADRMHDTIASLAARAEVQSHPLLDVREVGNVEILVLSADRGLCGAFNNNILKAANRLRMDSEAEGLAVSVSSVGKKATDYFRHRSVQLRKKWLGLSGRIDYRHASEISNDIMELYTSEVVDKVYLVYNQFKNVGQQEVRVVQLLPTVSPGEAEPIAEDSHKHHGATSHLDVAGFLYEPSEAALLSSLLPKNVEVQVFRALLESNASEEAARMTAMENATKSANEMIGNLTLEYNKARQASITGELMDIVGGVEALKD